LKSEKLANYWVGFWLSSGWVWAASLWFSCAFIWGFWMVDFAWVRCKNFPGKISRAIPFGIASLARTWRKLWSS